MSFTEWMTVNTKAWKCFERLTAAQKPDVLGRLDFVRRFCITGLMAIRPFPAVNKDIISYGQLEGSL